MGTKKCPGPGKYWYYYCCGDMIPRTYGLPGPHTLIPCTQDATVDVLHHDATLRSCLHWLLVIYFVLPKLKP